MKKIKEFAAAAVTGILMFIVVYVPGRNYIVSLLCGGVCGVFVYIMLYKRKPSIAMALTSDDGAFFEQGIQHADDISKLVSHIGHSQIKTSAGDLVTLTRRILEAAQKKPESYTQVQRFLTYYLPVTRDLLTRYAEMERNRLASPETLQFSDKLAGFLTDAKQAFQTQLQRLFDGDIQDASAEIDAMKASWQLQGLLDTDDAFTGLKK